MVRKLSDGRLKKILSANQELINWIVFGAFVIIIYYLSSKFSTMLVNGELVDLFTKLLPSLQDFLTLTLSVVVEATPFLILGVIVSALIRKFLPSDKLLKILPKNAFLRRIVLSMLGIALPVCECGNVPVARSLMAQGLKTADVISFLFAAPILNPITIVATMTAFSFQPQMVWWRVIFALIIVQITAFIVSLFKEDSIINPGFKEYCHAHKNDSSFLKIFDNSRNEFWQLFTMLVIGASIAAATQVFVPRFIINTVGGDIFLSVIAMIVLSFVVSICSSIDAFFALAYARSFTAGSILSFLLSGPMVDIKMIILMKTTFRWHFIATIVLIIFALSFMAGVGVNLYVR